MYGIYRNPKNDQGGPIEGPGTGTSDSIKKQVPAGSYIMPADSTARLGLNPEMLKKYKEGLAAKGADLPRLGARKNVPVNLSNGEYELPPEQVHAVGVETLNQVKEATHSPAAPRLGVDIEAFKRFKQEKANLPRLGVNADMIRQHKERQSKELFFADGGLVEDPDKLPRLGVKRWTQEQRAEKQTQLATQTQALRDARNGAQSPALSSLPAQRPEPVQNQTSAGTVAPAPTSSPNLPRWNKTGVDADRQGGEIATRTGVDGVPEFSNEQSAVAGAQELPRLGVGRGAFSQAEPGDAQLAYDRNERAIAERDKMIDISRRGEIGEGGGRVTVVADSSRAPTMGEIWRNRQEGRQAQTEALRAQTEQGSALASQRVATEQLQQQQLRQQIEGGRYDLQGRQRLAELGEQLTNSEPEQRADVEREYLLRADPQAYLGQQSKAGIDQVELETKQLKRDQLRSELDQSGTGGTVKLTEQQSKDLGYFSRGNEANAQLARQGDALTARATDGRSGFRGMLDTAVRGTPLVGDSALGNSLVSTERQQAEQSGREVLSAILRKDTGAAITNQEMDIYGKMYLPQAGDSEEVLNQKAEARTRALASIRGGLGTAERKASPVNDGRRNAAGAPAQVRNDQDYAVLPSGTTYVAPDGTTRRKP
jgi:hypothetical protein